MPYTVQNLTEVADCDLLLTWAQTEKGDLEFKELTDTRLITKYSTTSFDIEATLQGVLAEIAATDTIIAALPEDPSRQDAQNRKIRLEYQKFTLETRKTNYGFVALLQKENELRRTQQQIIEVDQFITEVTAKREALMPS